MPTITTHINPDFDAITYAWLMQRFAPGFENSTIKFISFSNLDLELLKSADSVGDIGGEYDPTRLRFDHHHLPGNQATSTCAAKMAWEWLLKQGQDVAHLAPLIEEVYQGDLGKTPLLGIHAQLMGYKAWHKQNNDFFPADEAILTYGYIILDVLNVRLRLQVEAKQELEEKVVYKSEDGLIWAIRHAPTKTSFAAYEQGARIVVFEGEPTEVDGGTTYSVGISRAPEWQEPHCGNLIQQLLDAPIEQGIKEELRTWFQHPGGFFSGRGTPKGPVFSLVEIDIVILAHLIDAAWKREQN